MKCVVFLVLLAFLWTRWRGDTEVSCVFKESCILPCSFQGGSDVIIHWTPPNHSYYFYQDQIKDQEQRFRGRTSLFQDQISRGNASLLLTGVKVQDQGRYECQTSTDTGQKASFISLKVDAPVETVNIQQVENRITCSSVGIYPEPAITWSTSPPSKVILRSATIIQPSEQQLYNISSSLILSNNDTDLIYSCNVSTRTNSRRATLLRLSVVQADKRRGIALIVGVVLVAGFVGLVPLLLRKCDKSQQVEESHQREVSSREKGQDMKEFHTKGTDFEEESCLKDTTSQPAKKPNKCKLYIKLAGDKLSSSLRK
ncbi:CD276 antigen homolog [Odontesthes bonariensis]|uniref:CD276 antigen homolog n=1 Tax=Odontesthes bonariensis TaxID=219752 RepID=UPI003F58602A